MKHRRTSRIKILNMRVHDFTFMQLWVGTPARVCWKGVTAESIDRQISVGTGISKYALIYIHFH